MAGKPGARVIAAMLAVVDEGVAPYAAAHRFDIAISTIYRSVFYKAWQRAGYDLAARQNVRNELQAMQNGIGQRKPRYKPR